MTIPEETHKKLLWKYWIKKQMLLFPWEWGEACLGGEAGKLRGANRQADTSVKDGEGFPQHREWNGLSRLREQLGERQGGEKRHGGFCFAGRWGRNSQLVSGPKAFLRNLKRAKMPVKEHKEDLWGYDLTWSGLFYVLGNWWESHRGRKI